MLIMMILSLMSEPVYADAGLSKEQISDDIILVTDYNQFKKTVIKALKAHKKHISVYYPGMEKRFDNKHNDNYLDLWNSLQIDNGYYTGVVSGYCISYLEGKHKGKNIRYMDFQFNYLTTKKQERYMERKANKIAGRFKGKTRYEKIKGVHDYLISHMKYDAKYYNPYYAFKKGRGMCMSYSLAYQRILQELNIPCVYVKGKRHAWNLVKIGSYWYNVDVTWDDSTNSYKYFLKGYNNFHPDELKKGSYIKKLKIARYGYKK